MLIAPYHLSSNGLAERAVKQGLKKLTEGSLRDKLSKIPFQLQDYSSKHHRESTSRVANGQTTTFSVRFPPTSDIAESEREAGATETSP